MNQTRMFPHHHRYPFQIQKLWRWQTTFCLVCLVTITLIFFNNRSTLIIPSSFEKINIVENVAQEIEFVKRKLDQINKDEFGHCFKKSADWNFTYEWTLMPSSCRLDIDAVLLIKSSIYRAPLRWSLRETWAKNISWPGYNMKRVFLTGVAPSGQSTNLLNYEHSKYDDILQGDFEDTYKSVSKKIYTGMRFVKLHCPSVKWILVADDDAVMLPWNVLTYFLDSSNVISDQKVVDENQKILAGFDITGARTIRDKKDRWYVSPEEYSCPVYPPYVSGSLYALTYGTMEMFYSYARAFDPLFLDDVLLGVFARLSGAKFHHLPGNRFNFFCNGILSSHSVGERPPDYLACHGADLPSEQRNLWRQFCSQPIPSDRAIIGILNRVYCSSLV